MTSQNSNKLSLYLIIGIPVVGLLLTTAFYFYLEETGIRMGTSNNGTLISPPKQIQDLPLQQTGQDYVWIQETPKWTFLVVGGASCDKACEDKLYYTRQVRRVLGKYMFRVENVYMSVNGQVSPEFASWAEKEHSELKIVSTESNAAINWAQKDHALDMVNGAYFYVVDQSGWVMMMYTIDQLTNEVDGEKVFTHKPVVTDMKFLLKNS